MTKHGQAQRIQHGLGRSAGDQRGCPCHRGIDQHGDQEQPCGQIERAHLAQPYTLVQAASHEERTRHSQHRIDRQQGKSQREPSTPGT